MLTGTDKRVKLQVFVAHLKTSLAGPKCSGPTWFHQSLRNLSCSSSGKLYKTSLWSSLSLLRSSLSACPSITPRVHPPTTTVCSLPVKCVTIIRVVPAPSMFRQSACSLIDFWSSVHHKITLSSPAHVAEGAVRDAAVRLFRPSVCLSLVASTDRETPSDISRRSSCGCSTALWQAAWRRPVSVYC